MARFRAILGRFFSLPGESRDFVWPANAVRVFISTFSLVGRLAGHVWGLWGALKRP